jgi:hypothetical protein
VATVALRDVDQRLLGAAGGLTWADATTQSTVDMTDLLGLVAAEQSHRQQTLEQGNRQEEPAERRVLPQMRRHHRDVDGRGAQQETGGGHRPNRSGGCGVVVDRGKGEIRHAATVAAGR